MDETDAARALSALAQETRLRAIFALAKERCDGIPAGRLAEELGVPHNTMSVHLKILQSAGLVESKRQSRSIIYKARPEAVAAVFRFVEAEMAAGS